MLLLPESESLGQNIRIKAIRGTSRVSLHPPERSSGDHPDGNAFVVSLFDIEILVTERLPQSRKEIEAESVGRNATNRRIRSAQIFGGYVIDIRIFDDAAQGRFQALDFVRIRSYEEVQVGSRASQPVQASATDPNTAYSTRCSANARKIALSRCSSGIRGSFIHPTPRHPLYGATRWREERTGIRSEGRLVEAAGIEPASGKVRTGDSTRLAVSFFISPRDR